MASIPAPTGDYLTIAEAADKLGVKPWEVVRRIETGQIEALILVPAAALQPLVQETT